MIIIELLSKRFGMQTLDAKMTNVPFLMKVIFIGIKKLGGFQHELLF